MLGNFMTRSESNPEGSKTFEPEATLRGLRDLLDTLVDTKIEPAQISHARRRRLQEQIGNEISELDRVSEGISLVRMPKTILDPS